MLFVVIGARGAGKSTLIEKLRERGGFVVLQPSTTRKPRSTSDSEYDFVERWKEDLYAWKIDVGSEKYGMRKSEVSKADAACCVTVFDPVSIEVLKKFEETAGFEIVTIGLDTLENLDEQHSRVPRDDARKMSSEQFQAAVDITRKADLVLRGTPERLVEAVLAAKSVLGSRGGTLSRRHLAPLLEAGAVLVGELEKSSLKSASYDLSIGSQVWCKGELIKLSDQRPTFTIPPYSYAVVTAREEAWLPTFLAGTFDIKVGMFLRGTILSNGPQVDPGYRGPLFCMLFNGSSDPKTLARYSHFATIEFSTVTHKSPAYSDRYQLQRRLEEIMAEGGLSGQGGNIVEDFESKYKQTNSRLDSIAYWALGTVGAVLLLAMGHVYWVQSEVDKIEDLGVQVQSALQLERELRDNQESSVSGDVQALDDQLAELADELRSMIAMSSVDASSLANRVEQLERSLLELRQVLDASNNTD